MYTLEHGPGLWQAGEQGLPYKQVKQLVDTALEQGATWTDTAAAYPNSDENLARIVQEQEQQEAGSASRYQRTSKYGLYVVSFPPLVTEINHSRARLEEHYAQNQETYQKLALTAMFMHKANLAALQDPHFQQVADFIRNDMNIPLLGASVAYSEPDALAYIASGKSRLNMVQMPFRPGTLKYARAATQNGVKTVWNRVFRTLEMEDAKKRGDANAATAAAKAAAEIVVRETEDIDCVILIGSTDSERYVRDADMLKAEMRRQGR